MVMITQIRDTSAPVITILTPGEGSSYGTTVAVTGVVTDSAATGGAPGRVHSFSYQVIPATLPGGSISVASDGTFTLSFDTGSFTGPMIVVFTAVDWNRNQSEARLNLADQGAVPSFTATAGNQQVTLTWDPVPLTSGYTLYYTTDGSLPSPQYGNRIDAVESPLSLTGLANGSLHVFLLHAHAREGRDNWSWYREAIPLSALTLAPRVTGQYREILVEWRDIPATDEFDVLRSDSRQGTCATVASRVRGRSFNDAMVEPGRLYYYKVRPSLEGSVVSAPNPGETADCPRPEQRILGSCATPGPALGIVLSQGYAYVAASEAGLAILDISDPVRPSLLGSRATGAIVGDVAVQGGYAYCADSQGLKVIDIGNPSVPSLVGSYEAIPCNSVEVAGQRAFITSFMSMHILDISDPRTPALLGSYNVAGSGWFAPNATDAVVNDDLAYVLSGVLDIVDISNPASPQLLGSTSDLNGPGMTTFRFRMALAGNCILGPSYEAGLKIIDVGDPGDPRLAGVYDSPGIALAATVHGSNAFLADGTSGLSVIDISTPASPRVVAWSDTPDICSGVAVEAGLAYVADGTSGVRVLDVFSPTALNQSSTYPLSGEVSYSVAVSDRRLFISRGDGSTTGGVQIVDVSDPSHPVDIGFFDAGSSVFDVRVSGDYAFVGTATKGLQVFNISNPSSPVLEGGLTYAGSVGAANVEVAGDRIVLGLGAGVVVADVSVPSRPSLLSSFLTSLNPTSFDMTVRGSTIYVANGEIGLHILDFSNPGSITQTGLCNTPGTASGVAVSGELALVADSSSLQVIDVSDPSAPVIRSSLPISAYSVTTTGSYAFVSSADEGVRIVDFSNPACRCWSGTTTPPARQDGAP